MKPDNKIVYLKEVDSTNTYMLENEKSFYSGMAVYTDNQVSGRGTKGRVWQQDKGKSLALSVLYRLPTKSLTALPLVTGIAVTQALEELSGINTQLKWSNDVIANGKKLGGILCESKIQKDTSVVVLGIGINIGQTQETFIEQGIPHAISLGMLDVKLELLDLAECIVKKLEVLLKVHADEGFSGVLRDMYIEKSVMLGREVLIMTAQKQQKAVAEDIDFDGSLICIVDGQKIKLSSGEVSVRGINGYI